jgi:dTDP-4-dehydrorhamnose 3,5-epimerase
MVSKTNLNGVLLIDFDVYEDNRGWFFESFNMLKFENDTGIKFNVKQNMMSKSFKNTIRGLHYQIKPHIQQKLVHVLSGKILDVIVDIRLGSPDYGKHIAIELTESSKKQVFIPDGFAHGFSVLSDVAEVCYSTNEYYSKKSERGILFNDYNLGIDWKVHRPIISSKDLNNKKFCDIDKDFYYEN